jgi:hypothetical protein
MKLKHVAFFALVTLVSSCTVKTGLHLNGSWQLVSGTTITKGDTTFTDYTKNQSMIKIINDTHFAFLKHSLKQDTTNNFDAGGGRYTLTGDKYTEHLDYYNDKNWEGKSFDFTVSISNDTLIQQGIEKVEAAGIERVIIEKYIKIQ